MPNRMLLTIGKRKVIIIVLDKLPKFLIKHQQLQPRLSKFTRTMDASREIYCDGQPKNTISATHPLLSAPKILNELVSGTKATLSAGSAADKALT